MDSLVKLEDQFGALRKKRRDAIIQAFDGRTQSFISDKTGIDAIKLNKWISGGGSLSDAEIEKLEQYLEVNFK